MQKKRKMKLCHICTLGMTGLAVFVCNLLENSDYDRYDITIVNFGLEHADPVISRIKNLPVKIVDPPKGNLFVFCRFLNHFFKHNHFDIIHSHVWDLSGLFLAIAHHRGISIRVVHSHNTSKAKKRYNRVKEFVRDKVIWRIFRHMIKTHANRFVCCSEEAAKWLYVPPIINKMKYTVIPNGINLSWFSNPQRVIHKPIEILFAGRFDYQKNPVFAVECFSEYLKINPTAHMTMVGKGKMDSEVRTAINKFGLAENVIIVTETNEMPKYYQSADIFLLPSNYEGLGIVLIEAQASGLKCLASDNIPNEVQCGLVRFKPLQDGARAWGHTIEELIHDDEMKINLEQLNHYSIEYTVKLMDKVYST